jgi:hypothetical protein
MVCPEQVRLEHSEATEGWLPAFFPVLMVTFLAISGMGMPRSLSARAKTSMSSSMTLGRPPWLPRAAAVCWPSRVFSRM